MISFHALNGPHFTHPGTGERLGTSYTQTVSGRVSDRLNRQQNLPFLVAIFMAGLDESVWGCGTESGWCWGLKTPVIYRIVHGVGLTQALELKFLFCFTSPIA